MTSFEEPSIALKFRQRRNPGASTEQMAKGLTASHSYRGFMASPWPRTSPSRTYTPLLTSPLHPPQLLQLNKLQPRRPRSTTTSAALIILFLLPSRLQVPGVRLPSALLASWDRARPLSRATYRRQLICSNGCPPCYKEATQLPSICLSRTMDFALRVMAVIQHYFCLNF